MRGGFDQCLYVMQADYQLVKVGVSVKPCRRLKELNDGPYKLILDCVWMLRDVSAIQAREVEKAVHTVLAEERIKGEWFRFEPGLYEKIEKAVSHECVLRGIHVVKLDVSWEPEWDKYEHVCDCEHHDCWYPVQGSCDISVWCVGNCDECGEWEQNCECGGIERRKEYLSREGLDT